MPALITLASVKEALRIAERDAQGAVLPHEDDALLQLYAETAQEAVLRYLRAPASVDWTADTAPKAVIASIVLAVQSLYDPDQHDLLGGLASSDPKNPIVALLCMMRRPTAR